MGGLKDFGKLLGEIAGATIGGSVIYIGEKLDSRFLEETGQGVYNATKKSGEILGQVMSGVVDAASGKINSDSTKLKQGLTDLGQATDATIMGVFKGLDNIVSSGSMVIDGIKEVNTDKIKAGSRTLAQVGLVGVLAIGVVDVMDGVDGVSEITNDSDMAANFGDSSINANGLNGFNEDLSAPVSDQVVLDNNEFLENPGDHHVDPHWVDSYVRDDGTFVEGYWRDGDGDSSINSVDGWIQSNPDFRVNKG